MPAVSQAGVMSAISVLEVQFDNNVQFLPESKILPPAFVHSEMTSWKLCLLKRLFGVGGRSCDQTESLSQVKV